ncbi:coiled-coil domain-containing protein 42-like [Mobula birostris]|uniref:coiled-coil domain-containing protein 42-like n=1 Tax=Mobula birostris TaxID=1983395 RepID=UPI003B286A42
MDTRRRLSEHFRSQYREELLQDFPHDDSLSLSTQLLAKRRLGMDINQALDSQRQEFNVKMERMRLWKQNFTKRCDQMKEQILKFDNFVQENERKRARALWRAETEGRLRVQRRIETEQLRARLRELHAYRDMLRRSLAANARFPEFVQLLLRPGSMFRELSEVPVRYRALVSTREALLRLVQEGHEERERRKGRLNRYLEETSDERLQLSNRLADLQAQLEAARSRSLRWDAAWTHIQNTAARQTLVLGTVKMATLNLYQLVAGSLGEAPSLTSTDTLLQLQKVEEFIHHLKSVWEDLMSEPHLSYRAQNRLMK